MTLEYELTLDDHVGFQMHLAERSPTVRRMRLAWLAFYCVLGLGATAVVAAVSQHPPVIALVAGVFLAYLPFYKLDWRRANRGRIRRFLTERGDPGTGPCTLAISADGIRGQHAGAEARYPWSSVVRVESGAEGSYAFVTSANAAIVPHRAFPDEEARYAFWSEFNRLREESSA